jgi:hypothetical protein
MSQVLLVNLEISLFFRLLASIYLFLVDAILLGYGGVCSFNRRKLKKKDTGFNFISILNFIVHFLYSYLCHNVDSNCVSVTN